MNDLKDKAIKIKGKDYVQVKDRVLFFNEEYTNGRITTELISNEGDEVVVKATVTPDVKNPERYFTGYSQANKTQGMINKTAALENCETSAIGRALASMGIGILDGLASADEMYKAGLTKDEVLEKGLENMEKPWCKLHNKEMKHKYLNEDEEVIGHWRKNGDDWELCQGEGFNKFSYSK